MLYITPGTYTNPYYRRLWLIPGLKLIKSRALDPSLKKSMRRQQCNKTPEAGWNNQHLFITGLEAGSPKLGYLIWFPWGLSLFHLLIVFPCNPLWVWALASVSPRTIRTVQLGMSCAVIASINFVILIMWPTYLQIHSHWEVGLHIYDYSGQN